MTHQNTTNGIEDNLEDGNVPEVNFKGGTLSLNSPMESGNLLDEGNTGAGQPQQQQPPPPAPAGGDLDQYKPGQPILGRPSSAPCSPIIQEGFYASKCGRLEEAVNECKKAVIEEPVDGQVHGVWLLTEVDHWDNEKERVVIVTENCLLIVKYDFVAGKLMDCKRIGHASIDTIQQGVFSYPEKTLVTPRDGQGLRLYWNKGRQPSFAERWNPFCETIPWATFTSHPLEHSGARDVGSYKIDTFKTAVIQAVNVHRQKPNSAASNLPPVSEIEAPLECDIMLGASSTIWNQSRLGFFRERGGVSF
ncbi:tumor protein p63-regulated gene 1-like protein [Amphiura filiformis]|uniref:tumor protein p63-regulated gene 1-like protein n=1 Tax=Amphiura filiformis TaxID=82378 RepID=UPI003B2208F9